MIAEFLTGRVGSLLVFGNKNRLTEAGLLTVDACVPRCQTFAADGAVYTENLPSNWTFTTYPSRMTVAPRGKRIDR